MKTSNKLLLLLILFLIIVPPIVVWCYNQSHFRPNNPKDYVYRIGNNTIGREVYYSPITEASTGLTTHNTKIFKEIHIKGLGHSRGEYSIYINRSQQAGWKITDVVDQLIQASVSSDSILTLTMNSDYIFQNSPDINMVIYATPTTTITFDSSDNTSIKIYSNIDSLNISGDNVNMANSNNTAVGFFTLNHRPTPSNQNPYIAPYISLNLHNTAINIDKMNIRTLSVTASGTSPIGLVDGFSCDNLIVDLKDKASVNVVSASYKNISGTIKDKADVIGLPEQDAIKLNK